jgi:uncharacterized protein (DUF2141 family)
MLDTQYKTFYLFKPLFVGLVLLFSACAQVVRPTGGKTDIDAPLVLKFLPENRSLQFNQKTFSIQLNEFFVVKDISKQWVISPPLKRAPEYKIKGKILTITFDDTLKENTTYNFNFGKSIADVNEGNTLQGLSYIFSTGTFIDSLQLTGMLTQAFNNTSEKEVLVMLYEESRCNIDSFPYKLLPDYFAISDAAGKYTLKYIKPGKYKAIALKDANSNYLFDSFEESIGFCDSVINLNANAQLNFKMFKELEEKTYLKNKSNSEYGFYQLSFNKALPNIELIPLHNSKNEDWAFVDINKTQDTVNIYLKDFSIDTLKLALKSNETPFDTVEFAVLPKEKYLSKNKRVIVSKTIIKIDPATGTEKDLNRPVGLKINHPIVQINTDSILFFEGDHLLPFKVIKKDSLGKIFELEAKLLNDSSYKLTILPGAFRDCFDNTNDTAKSSFIVPSIESVGNLYLNILADSSKKLIDFKLEHLLLQLLNEKGDVLKTQLLSNYGIVSYLNCKPGNYKVQMIIDANKNNQWDTGNFLKKNQAEKIIPMNASLNLRGNWDLEEEWKIVLAPN